MEEDSVCPSCNQGTLVRSTVRRMNGFLVVVGFILLIPAVIGMLIGGAGALGSGIVATQAKRSPEEIRGELNQLKVPDATIERVLAGNFDAQVDSKDLNPEQQKAVAKAVLAAIGKKAPTDVMVGSSLVIVAVSFVIGLVGWLFIRKKSVFLCSKCPAVAPAS